MDVVLLVAVEDEALIKALVNEPTLQAERLQGAGIHGGGEVTTIVVSAASAGLTALVAILRARWARAKYVKIEVDGVKVHGASPEQIETLLTQLLEARSQRATRSHAPKS